MTDPNDPTANTAEQPPAPPAAAPDPLQPAIIVYALFGAGIFFAPAALAGLIYAYVSRGADPVLDTHLSFLIRTFWWGLLWIFVSLVLFFFLIGVLVGLVWMAWLVVRIITGLQLAQKQLPVSGTEAMGFKVV